MFRSLQWKLTSSYLVATTLVSMLILLAIWSIIWTIIFRTGFVESVVHVLGISYVNVATEQYLQEDEIDREGVRRWLERTMADDEINLFLFGESVPVQQPNVKFVSIHDGNGDVITIQPEDTQLGNLRTFTPQSLITGWKNAIVEQRIDLTLLRHRLPEDNIDYFYLPLQDEAMMVIALPISEPTGTEEGGVFAAGAVLFLSLLCPIILLALLVGLPYGYLLSRGMVRRLRRLQTAADSWAEGDFDVTVRDGSRDEIGQLGRQLNGMAEQLETLVQSRGELATLEERNRLARDLHDSAKQQIFATKMQLSAAKAMIDDDPKTAKTFIEEAEELANQVQRELSGLILELRPAQLDGRGLFEAIVEASEHFSRRNNVIVDVATRGQRELPLEIEQTLLRIHQESLANVVKHSHATEIKIRLLANNELVTLMVKDNGLGFNLGEHPAGLGLQSMQERIKKQGGRFDVSSTKGNGTRILATCVLAK